MQTPDKRGWLWNIPLHGDRLSCGIVRPFDDIFKNRGGGIEQTFEEEVENTPYIKHRIGNAKRVTGYFATRDYSYRATRAGRRRLGDGRRRLRLPRSALLVGRDAGPQVGRAGRRRHPAALAKGDTSKAALGVWAPMFNQGIDRMRRLVCEYYAGFNFGTFIRHHPELRGAITDLLIGDLFTEAADRGLGPDGRARRRRQDGHRAVARRSGRPRRAGQGATIMTKPEGVHLIGWTPVPQRRSSYRRRVQFYETDAAGIVHFSNFFRYMEEAEHALWRENGISIFPAEPTHGWPRVAASFDYKRPLRFEDEFEVHLAVTQDLDAQPDLRLPARLPRRDRRRGQHDHRLRAAERRPDDARRADPRGARRPLPSAFAEASADKPA